MENKCTFHPTNLNMNIPDPDCETCIKPVNELKEAIKDIKFPVRFQRGEGDWNSHLFVYDNSNKPLLIMIKTDETLGHKIAEFINSLNK